MEITELLSLEKNIATIKKIDQFLAKTDKNSADYLKAFCFKMQIWAENKRINEAIKEVYSYVPYFKQMLDEDVIIICDTIMSLTLQARRLDEYQKYMQIKSSRLPASRTKEKHEDAFYYYLALKEYKQAVIEAKAYLTFSLLKEEKLKMELELLEIGEILNDITIFDFAKEAIETLYKDSFDFAKITSFHLRVLKMYFRQENYQMALTYGIDFLDDSNLDIDQKIIAASIVLKVYLKNEEYNKATIFEAKYADLLESATPNDALEFAKTALILYQKVNHKISISYYEDLIADFEKRLKIQLKENKKNKPQIVVIPEIFEKPTVNVKQNSVDQRIEFVEQVETKIKEAPILSKNILEFLNGIFDLDLPFREVLRKIGSALPKQLEISEFDVMYFEGRYYHHKYKNDRVYDRNYLELADSWQKKLLENDKEIFIAAANSNTELDLFYQKPVENEYIYFFPLYKNESSSGIITIYSKIDFYALGNYELIKAMTLLIRKVLLLEISKNRFSLENNFINYIFSNACFGYKILAGNKLKFSSQGAYLLRLEEKSIDYEKFISNILEEERQKYKEFILDLRNNPRNNAYIIYGYKNGDKLIYLKEYFYVYYDEELTILSIFYDVTSDFEKEKRLEYEIFYNTDSTLANKRKLIQDINLCKYQKYLLGIFSLNNLEGYKEVYGYKFYDEFIKIISKALNDYCKNNFTAHAYQINETLFAILLNTKEDKRLISNKMKQFLDYLEVSFINFNYTIPIHFSLGIYRQTLYETNKDALTIIDYAYNTYRAILQEDCTESKYAFFSQELYKYQFKNRVIEVSLKEALDNGKFQIKYHQVVDINKLEVYGYYSRLTVKMEGFANEEIASVVDKWNLQKKIDKYKLTHICMDLKQLFMEFKGYVDIFVELDLTSIDETLKSFIQTQLSFFKVPSSAIKIIVNEYHPRLKELEALGIVIISRNIYDIINHNTDYLLLDYLKINLNSMRFLLEYLESFKANVILENVSKIEMEKLKEQKISYLFGDIYPKSYTIAELIEKIKLDN